MPYSLILESVMSLYVTLVTDPVAPSTVLIRTPFCELVTVELSIRTFATVLSERPPTDPWGLLAGIYVSGGLMNYNG